MRKSTLAARLGALVIGSALLTAPRASRAAEPGPDTLPLNVVAIEGNDAEDQAEALTKALRNTVRGMYGWSLSPGDYSMEVLVLSMKCVDPPDATCQAKIADEIKVDRYVWGFIKKKGPNVVGELALWVRGKGTTKVPLEYSANLTEANDDSLKRVAMDAMNRLTGGAPKGGVHVRAGNIGGQLFIDGEPVGALTNGEASLQIPSGTHTLTVKAPGYEDAQTQVFIKPNKVAEASLTLVKAEAKGGTSGRAIAGWSMVAGGGALIAAGGVTGILQVISNSDTQKSKTYTLLLQNKTTGQPEGQTKLDPCGWANEIQQKGDAAFSQSVQMNHALSGQLKAAAPDVVKQCSKNSTLTTMQIIFYPAGAVIGGVGLYLLITAPSRQAAPTTGWTVQPYVGPSGGKLDFTYTF